MNWPDILCPHIRSDTRISVCMSCWCRLRKRDSAGDMKSFELTVYKQSGGHNSKKKELALYVGRLSCKITHLRSVTNNARYHMLDRFTVGWLDGGTSHVTGINMGVVLSVLISLRVNCKEDINMYACIYVY